MGPGLTTSTRCRVSPSTPGPVRTTASIEVGTRPSVVGADGALTLSLLIVTPARASRPARAAPANVLASPVRPALDRAHAARRGRRRADAPQRRAPGRAGRAPPRTSTGGG